MDIFQQIKEDSLITKFNFYGFFKNLKFFEPYLIVFLLGMDYSLFQVGILYSVREAITYIFEVPSGIMADHYGKKKVLLFCFVSYIISFIFFFWSPGFPILIVAMIFFGLGEAFRSGAHKALILAYLDYKNWFEYKGFVYGRTRSYSLVGSSISAFVSIIMVLNLPSLRWVFLVSIIPYIADFALVLSYPDFIDQKTDTVKGIKSFYMESVKAIKDIWSDRALMKIVLSSSTFDGVFRTLKDYVQPVLGSLLLVAGFSGISSYGESDQLTIYLGILYGVFYIFSSLASRNIYRVTTKFSAAYVFNRMYDFMGIAFVMLAIALRQDMIWVVVSLFFLMYIMKDSRKPVFVDFSSDFMKKDQRATVLSIESQVRALFMVILAPTLGWIADTFSLEVMFLGVGVFILIANRVIEVDRERI
jgi:MFS family permease